MSETQDRRNAPHLLTPIGFAGFSIAFAALFYLANRVVHLYCSPRPDLDCPASWPISIFRLRAPPELYFPQLSHFAAAVATLSALILVLVVLQRARYKIALVACAGVMLILGSNLIQGSNFGFTRPISGPDEYYTDALRIENPVQFVATFVERQAEYGIHSRSHPPGAVLTIYVLSRFLEDPALISVAIAAISGMLTAVLFHHLISSEHDEALAGYVTFLLLLVPSVQIYYAASLDAVIAMLLLGALAFFVTSTSRLSTVVVFVFMSLASFLTFGFSFIIPVIIGHEWLTSRKLKRSGVLIITLVLLYLIVYVLTGFNYAESFLIASMIENPQGFRLFADPVGYLVTRIENIAEIVFFFGPFLTLLAYLGLWWPQPGDRLTRVTVLGLVSLGLMFLAGVFRTGETARAAMFIYPFLMLPVARALADRDVGFLQKSMLAVLIFAQGAAMQLVGNYIW
ncbi:MAG: hypothetical protein ABIJ39_09800 [Chloroflexota bacterium]